MIPEIRDGSLIVGGATSVGYWELECQQALVSSVVRSHGLRVLEIGYGLGMAFAQIERLYPKIHVTVELNPFLAQQAYTRGMTPGRAVVCMSWQDSVNIFREGSFDAIVFDPDPSIPADIAWGTKQVVDWIVPGFLFLSPLLAQAGRMAFIDFTNEAYRTPDLKSLRFNFDATIETQEISIAPPLSCKYAVDGMATITVLARG